MIIDIDNANSVQSFVSMITSDWFDIDAMYYDLKSKSQINWTNFWNITHNMIDIISNCLGHTSEEFLNSWETKCIEQDAKIMGYHCTRHSNKEVFIKNGVLPLSEETINLSQTQKRPDAENLWDYRSKRGSGPYFFLSYKSARNPNNHFFKGPEILLAVNGHQPSSNSEKSSPFIIHCAIPFSILPDKKYYTFCILRAYFNFLDPEDEIESFFEAYSIDLKGNTLDPQHIVKIEYI